MDVHIEKLRTSIEQLCHWKSADPGELHQKHRDTCILVLQQVCSEERLKLFETITELTQKAPNIIFTDLFETARLFRHPFPPEVRDTLQRHGLKLESLRTATGQALMTEADFQEWERRYAIAKAMLTLAHLRMLLRAESALNWPPGLPKTTTADERLNRVILDQMEQIKGALPDVKFILQYTPFRLELDRQIPTRIGQEPLHHHEIHLRLAEIEDFPSAYARVSEKYHRLIQSMEPEIQRAPCPLCGCTTSHTLVRPDMSSQEPT